MRLVGARVARVEDRRILTGRGHYIDDLHLPRTVHAAFLRSPFAHARITDVNIADALEAPGVLAVLTGSDIRELIKAMPGSMAANSKIPEYHALATGRVRFVGDPVVMIVAFSRRAAEDAAELIDVTYDPLPPVMTYESALDPESPCLFDDLPGNVQAQDSAIVGDVDGVFASADRVVSRTFQQHRVAPVPMETRGAVADYDAGSGELTFHCNSQAPHGLRIALADVLSISVDRVRVLTKDIGGAFGLKSCFGREDFCVAAAARLLGRPVKWIEDRYEHLLASGQAREEKVDIDVAVDDGGMLLGMRAHMTLDQGAYPGVPFPADGCTRFVQVLLPGPYRWKAYSYGRTVVVSNKCTYLAYRGPWEVETWVRERMLDEVARELAMDPAELRRRNMVTGEPDDRLITGLSLSGVSSRDSLDRALELIDYDGFRRLQEEGRSAGRCLGIGFATFIEAAPGPIELRTEGGPFGGEVARVELDSDGHLLVITSQVPHGQSHETTLAQIAADEMGVPFEHVRVLHGDTRYTPFKLIGTAGSMSATWASGAVQASTREVKRKVLELAGEILEVSTDDLDIADGVITPRGVPARSLTLAEVATQATLAPGRLPAGADVHLAAEERFRGAGITGSGWSGGTHICTVDIDLDTGRVQILRYVVIEDCGRVINPAVVEGQVRGGVAQGIGEVLYERAAYDEDGNFLAATFMDYLLPTASEIPVIEIDHMETSPEGDIGYRGVGEGGAIVAPAALTNAISDALAPYGALVCEQSLPPARVLELAGVIDPS